MPEIMPVANRDIEAMAREYVRACDQWHRACQSGRAFQRGWSERYDREKRDAMRALIQGCNQHVMHHFIKLRF